MTIIKELRAAGVECYTRTQWESPQQKAGAYRRRRRTHPMPKGPARYHFLHITVTHDTDTLAEGAAGMRQVEGYGYSTPPTVSYQDCVTNEGRYFEGQNYRVKGTHTINDKDTVGYPHDLNAYGYATALLQNVGDDVTEVQADLVAMIFAARELKGLVAKGAPVLPHRLFAWKSCPGDKAMVWVDWIVERKNHYVTHGLPVNPDLRFHLERAREAAESGDLLVLRRHLRLGAEEASALGKVLLAARLWHLRRKHTGPGAVKSRKPYLADLLAQLRDRHTR